MNVPIISVIIPTYNSEKTIKITVESILNQSFHNFELIIINDGSNDSTLDIISNIHDSRIKLFTYSNAGANVSRNRGLSYAVGEFVSFIDADDIWTNDKLQSQIKALQDNPEATVSYSWTDYIDENDQFVVSGTHIAVNGNVYEELLLTNFLENGSNPLIRKEALIELGGFDESLNAGQDWEMWLRLAAKYNFVAVPKVQILYRISPKSQSSNLARQEKACLQVLEKAYQLKSPVNKINLSASLANLYKYLTCKALQKPYNRHKALVASRFLWNYIINEPQKNQRLRFIFKLSAKIAIILFFPTYLSTLLLNKAKTKEKIQVC
ncbi:glycosyl transferase family protein [Calothrix sp. NIES-4071]|nr:glycosyl transferase family protein [Calothrix sp. NIES-4071]BAZ61024.1 glycosyl transferase family protein [Calothrix sp. NIES-4105]